VDLRERYREWSDKGPVIDGRRITILTGSRSYEVHEEVRIAHVMEALLPGYEVYVMGPKRVFDEYLDGHHQGKAQPADQTDPFMPLEYDGRVVESPATDFSYDDSIYFFDEPGEYEICWKPGKWQSNTLKIRVFE
jgi:hypothetical protein